MERQYVRLAMMAGAVALMSVAPASPFQTVSQAAQVNVNVNIGTPPPVIVHSRPTMVYLPEPAAYVAVAVPYDIYFVSGRYYRVHGSNWFWAMGYGGPWTFVEYRSVPPGLRKYKVEKLHEFRDREYKVYVVEGSKFKGKHFEAEEHHGDHDRDDDHGKGNSSSSGNGRGNSGNNGNGRGNGKK